MVWNGRLTADTRNSAANMVSLTTAAAHRKVSAGALKAEAASALPPVLTPVSLASFPHVLDFQLKLETPAQWI